MLKQLHIKNIILIEEAVIGFKDGFNILSGETGSGKSAVMGSLALILGEKGDTSIIRKGSDKGIVEASFDVEDNPLLQKILIDAGIEYDSTEELIIRREINATGKSRAFINNQMAQMGLLKKIGEGLIDFVGQHANQRLLSCEQHRRILDTYASLTSDVAHFGELFHEENKVRQELEELIHNEAKRLREIEVCRMELEELQEGAVKEGEEEELFKEFSLLSHSEELSEKLMGISNGLNHEKLGALTIMRRLRFDWESILRLDSSLSPLYDSYQAACIELQEIGYSLEKYLNSVEINPDKLTHLEKRLSLINQLKKKYGSTIEQMNEYQKQLEEKLHFLENADQHIEQLQTKLKKLEIENQDKAEKLTKERTTQAQALQKAVTEQLRQLNMPKVEFQIDIQPQKRSKAGDDHIEFFMIPNLGEHRIPIKDCASGGELSRVLLAFQALLAGKEKIPVIVFDEIDSNIGGSTAHIVGEKLKEIGNQHQVLCITHFPQVAKHADSHLKIAKKEVDGRTITTIQLLDEQERDFELNRMHGMISC